MGVPYQELMNTDLQFTNKSFPLSNVQKYGKFKLTSFLIFKLKLNI